MNSPVQEFFSTNPDLVDLHVHIGSISHPALLWDIAHEMGLRFEIKDYWAFHKTLTVKQKIRGTTPEARLSKYLDFFHMTERIQSSPYAMNRVVYDGISGAYRKNNIKKLELRFCPMLRNNQGIHDLDQIIISTIHALDRGMIAFPEVKCGLVFSLDRRFSKEKNSVILEKAIKYKSRGVIGIDIGGPRREGFFYEDYADIYQEARKQGLKTTVHTGEEGAVEEMDLVLDALKPHRVGHGIKGAQSKNVIRKLLDRDIVLEICPTSNLKLGMVKDIADLHKIMRTFIDAKVKFTINTDGPELLQTNLKQEISLLLKHRILSVSEALESVKHSHAASFLV
jgi:adenosine deaminase